VIAIVSAYNEADIISPVIEHLVENGIDVYLIDNRSTDPTVEEARRWLGKGLLQIETFPSEPPSGGDALPFDWTSILRRKEELASELDADWFLHHDADEIREAPWPGMNLRDAIAWADRLGYNAVGFRVFDFPPIDDGFVPGSDPHKHFSYWREAAEFDRVQLKCWKAGRPVSLVPSGGHEAAFPNRNVFPIPFLMRHYPIRGQEQGRRKVFEERKGRFLERERARDWHIQYDSISDPAHSFLADPAGLRLFDVDQARLELLLDNAVTRHEKYLSEQARLSAGEAARAAAALREEKAALAADLVALQQRAADLDTLANERQRRQEELARHLEAVIGRVAELERAVGHEQGRAAELERELVESSSRAAEIGREHASLEERHADARRRIDELEAQLASLSREIEASRGRLLPALRRLLAGSGRGN
jgi:hypothetical protein